MADKLGEQDYTAKAVAAIKLAVEHEHSFPEWLAHTLARAVADHPSGTYALIAGRPGSWEAALVEQLMTGTVGAGDEHLTDHAPPGDGRG